MLNKIYLFFKTINIKIDNLFLLKKRTFFECRILHRIRCTK